MPRPFRSSDGVPRPRPVQSVVTRKTPAPSVVVKDAPAPWRLVASEDLAVGAASFTGMRRALGGLRDQGVTASRIRLLDPVQHYSVVGEAQDLMVFYGPITGKGQIRIAVFQPTDVAPAERADSAQGQAVIAAIKAQLAGSTPDLSLLGA